MSRPVLTPESAIGEADSAAAFTPGPWSIREYGDGDSLVIESARDWRVCFMATPGDSPGAMAKIEANARLIRAAPEMLAALQDLMLIREWSIRAGATKGPLPHDIIVKFAEMQIPAVDAAYAAIAKALGQDASQ